MSDTPDKGTHITAKQALGAAVLQSLEAYELIDLLNRLRLFAAERYYGWLSADDLVMQAVTDVLDGKRRWNAAYPPFDNLCWVIRSIAFNQLQKEKRLLPIGQNRESDSGQPKLLPLTHPSAAELYEADENQRDLRKVLHQAVGDDGLLRRAVALFMNGEAWKPKEMAAELSVSEPEIYEAKRRIRRRLRKLLKKS
jgi:DNA-directed RNA polymerase specialized sigma24 family protein